MAGAYDYLLPYFNQLSGGSDKINAGFQSGLNLGDAFFPVGNLGRVTESPDDRSQTAVNLLHNTALGAFQRDPNIQKLIDTRMAGLNGMTPEESVAFREQAGQGLNQGLQTALRSLRSRNQGIGGPATFIGADPAIRGFADAQRGIQRDLINTNLGLKEQRMQGATDLVRGTDRDEFLKRLDSSNALLGGSLGLNQDIMSRQMYNQGQYEKEKAGLIGMTFGGGSFGASKEAADRAYKLGQDAIEAALAAGMPVPALPGMEEMSASSSGMPTGAFWNSVPGAPAGATFNKADAPLGSYWNPVNKADSAKSYWDRF